MARKTALFFYFVLISKQKGTGYLHNFKSKWFHVINMHFVLFLFSPDISTTLDKQNLVKERDQLSISLDQARDINRNLAEELHELQSRYEDLGKSKSQLEVELKKLKQELTGETSCKINRSLSLKNVKISDLFIYFLSKVGKAFSWCLMVVPPS